MPARPLITTEDFRQIYDRLKSPVARLDCGAKCAPLNGGQPVCCDTRNAIPIVDKTEWKFLKSRTDLWHLYKAKDANDRKILEDAGPTCTAIECKGARHCERDNRSLACRAFPFFPYIDREKRFFGLAYYWDFEDRCWVISNLAVVERDFLAEFVDGFEYLFRRDPEEFESFRAQSIAMRQVYSRRRQPIPLIGREGGYFKELPYGRGIRPAELAEFRKHGAYRSDETYARAVKRAAAEAAEEAP